MEYKHPAVASIAEEEIARRPVIDDDAFSKKPTKNRR